MKQFSLFLGLHITLILYLIRTSNSDVFSSIAEVAKLLQTESVLIQGIDNYIEEEEKRLDALRSYLEAYSVQTTNDPESFVSNPIIAFTLIKRLTIDWQRFETLIKSSITEGNLTLIKDSVTFPNDEDLKGASVAMLRLQETYNLSTSSLAQGMIKNIQHPSKMTASDCLELGKELLKNKEPEYARSWMIEAVERLKNEEKSTIDKNELFDNLALPMWNLITGALTNLDNILNFLKFSDNLLQVRNPVQNTENSTTFVNEIKTRADGLCRGDINQAPEIVSKLKCRYVSRSNPFLLIAPFKVEHLHHEHEIFLYHQVISDEEIATIKTIALTNMKRDEVVDIKTGKDRASDKRLSKSAPIKESNYESLKALVQRMSDLTGLTMQNSELLSIINYGLGGYYEYHTDFFNHLAEDDIYGNRIATLLFYLSDVELGGATVFPLIDVSVKPQKGTALFWYNLHASGEPNKNTVHKACPVLIGSKWIANKWIAERLQEFLRPCNLKKNK